MPSSAFLNFSSAFAVVQLKRFCSEFLDFHTFSWNPACTREHRPTQCSLAGFSANGGNGCMAKYNLLHSICEDTPDLAADVDTADVECVRLPYNSDY